MPEVQSGIKIFETFFSSLSKDLVNLVADSGLLFIIISLLSVGLTLAIKKSIKKVFLTNGTRIPNWGWWLINLTGIIIFSFLIMIIFKDSIQATYIILLILVSWVMSILEYELIVKNIDLYSEIFISKTRLKKLEVDVEIIEIQNKILETKNLNKELITEKLLEKEK